MAFNERASPPPPKPSPRGRDVRGGEQERREIIVAGVNNYVVRSSSPIPPNPPPSLPASQPPPPVSRPVVGRNLHFRSVPHASSRRIIHRENTPFSSMPSSNLSIPSIGNGAPRSVPSTSTPLSPNPSSGNPSTLRPPPVPLPPASTLVAAAASTGGLPNRHSSSASIAQRLNDPRGINHRHNNNNNGSNGGGLPDLNGIIANGNQLQNGSVNGHRRLPGVRTGFVPLSHERPIAPQQFTGLVKSILDHPSFPLVFCGAYESSTGSQPVITDIRAQNSLAQAATNCEQLESYAHQVGLGPACAASASLDVFMCGMVAALTALKDPRQPSIPAPLHDTIRACGNQPQILQQQSPNSSGHIRNGRINEMRPMSMGARRTSNANTHENHNNVASLPPSSPPSVSPNNNNTIAIATHTPTRPKLDAQEIGACA